MWPALQPLSWTQQVAQAAAGEVDRQQLYPEDRYVSGYGGDCVVDWLRNGWYTWKWLRQNDGTLRRVCGCYVRVSEGTPPVGGRACFIYDHFDGAITEGCDAEDPPPKWHNGSGLGLEKYCQPGVTDSWIIWESSGGVTLSGTAEVNGRKRFNTRGSLFLSGTAGVEVQTGPAPGGNLFV